MPSLIKEKNILDSELTASQYQECKAIFQSAMDYFKKDESMFFVVNQIADLAEKQFFEKCEQLKTHIDSDQFKKEGVIYAKYLITTISLRLQNNKNNY